MAKPVWAATAAGSFSTNGNWDNGTAPANGDEVLFRSNEFSVISDLNQSAVTLDELEQEASYTGAWGTALAELQLDATLVNLGRQPGSGSGAGSGRLKLNLGSVQFLMNIWSTASSATDVNMEPVRIRGTHASNVLNMYGGIVGVATNDPDDVATLATINHFSGILNLGAGCTLTTINMEGQGSVLLVRSAFTTLNQNEGKTTVYGSGARTTMSLKGGSVDDYGTGTVTTANVYGEATLNKWSGAATITNLNLYGTLDLSHATGAITVTNFNRLSDNAIIHDPLGRLVATNGIINGPGVRRLENYLTAGGKTFTI